MIRLAGLNTDADIRHAFFTREGGVSTALYSSLNCGFGSGDLSANVERNRSIAMSMMDARTHRLVTCRQVHSAVAVIVERPWSRAEAPAADGMATKLPGVALGVLAADCAPVLLCDPAARVIAATHAGWRGALGGVIEATLDAMRGLGAELQRIRAGIGPCIGPASYEVGPEFKHPIVARDLAAERYFVPARRVGHFMFDLAGYVAYRLTCAGVVFIERADCDTAADEKRFFSYRRARLRKEAAFGLGLSAIALDG
jgi:polyphenol oxidase